MLKANTLILGAIAAVLGVVNAGTAAAQGAIVKLLDYQTTAPASWKPRPPTSSSRLAMFVVPAADSANNAEIVVYSFGSTRDRRARHVRAVCKGTEVT